VGSVVDHQNHPLAGAKISLIQQTSALAVFTGPTGAFVLNNIKPGLYRVIASKAGYDPSLQNVNLSSTVRASVQFRLNQQSSPAVASLLKTRTARPTIIRGRALDANGNPIANERPGTVENLVGQVTDAISRRPVAGATVSISKQERTETDQTGKFAFANLSPGRYQLTISKPGYSSIQGSISIQSGKIAHANLTLQPKSTEPFEIRR
jgi:uncharacterized surface anchored protein